MNTKLVYNLHQYYNMHYSWEHQYDCSMVLQKRHKAVCTPTPKYQNAYSAPYRLFIVHIKKEKVNDPQKTRASTPDQYANTTHTPVMKNTQHEQSIASYRHNPFASLSGHAAAVVEAAVVHSHKALVPDAAEAYTFFQSSTTHVDGEIPAPGASSTSPAVSLPLASAYPGASHPLAVDAGYAHVAEAASC